jgi:hypothetical protein
MAQLKSTSNYGTIKINKTLKAGLPENKL